MSAGADVVFRAPSDPTRRALFESLARAGEQAVHGLTTHAGGSQPMVSRHLVALKSAGLVIDRRLGRETHHRVRPEELAPLIRWMDSYGAFWRERLDGLEDLLGRMDE